MSVWTLERIDELKRLRRAGVAYWRIARRLGVTRKAAMARGRLLGLRPLPRAPKWQDEPAPLGELREILGEDVCHWIAGDPSRLWRMCGHSSVHGSSWCAHHLERVRWRVGPAPRARGDAP
jgi:hypothetical protein